MTGDVVFADLWTLLLLMVAWAVGMVIVHVCEWLSRPRVSPGERAAQVARRRIDVVTVERLAEQFVQDGAR